MERNLQYYEEGTGNEWGEGGHARHILPTISFLQKIKTERRRKKCISNINIERYFTVCGAIYKSLTLQSEKNILKCKDASKFSNSPTTEKLLEANMEAILLNISVFKMSCCLWHEKAISNTSNAC
jgi:hypothetical protein